MECVCALTRPGFILSSERVLGMESEPVLTPREKSPPPGAQSRVEPATCIRQDSEPNTLIIIIIIIIIITITFKGVIRDF